MPSSHSGSSHSSSSHSSSSHSSFGSSRSSFGSSRSSFSGPSRHSFSSHSSSGSFGGFRSSASPRASSRGVSRHSGSSASSTAYRSHYVSSGSMRGSVISRNRTNQPTGYIAWQHDNKMPVTHYCLKHNYAYYPYDWTDSTTGASYKKGYYDEDGQYYEDVAFRYDGKYKDVLCKCEYCDTVTKLDWSEGGPLICPQCGGSLKIVSFLDEYTRDPGYEKARRQSDYVEYGGSGVSSGRAQGLNKFVVLAIAAVFFVVTLLIAGVVRSAQNRSQDPGAYINLDPDRNDVGGTAEPSPQSNVELFGLTLYLEETEPGVYRIGGREDYSRKLSWSYNDESYYDSDSGMWLWYNTEVLPNLWQYWYEPISGDFGDCGWMEYEPSGWYIERSEGDWIPVPEEYDTSELWHMEIDASDFETP